MTAITAMALGLAKSLLTEKFFIKMFLIAADKLVSSTDNKMDDKVVEAIKEALGER